MTSEKGDDHSGDEPWMSHHNGRVTGTKARPGAGDEEAGLAQSEAGDPVAMEGDGTPDERQKGAPQR